MAVESKEESNMYANLELEANADLSDEEQLIKTTELIDDEYKGKEKTKSMGLRFAKKMPELPQIERRNYLLHLHFVRGDVTTCKALITEQLDESGGNCQYALYIRGQLLRYEGKIQKSLETFQKCMALDPSNPLYMNQIGRSLFLLGKHEHSLEVFEQVINLVKDDREVYHWKALCHYHMKKIGAAKEMLMKAWTVKKHESSLKLFAEICAEEGDLMMAIEAYRKALEIAPENTEILTALGLLYVQTGSSQQAFDVLGKALTYDSSYVPVILAAGSMMQQYGDYDVALSKYRVAAQQAPNCAQLWSNIAMCFHEKQKHVAAISCLKKANYLAPLDWKILYNLGLVHLTMDQGLISQIIEFSTPQYASAFHYLSAAINLQPKVALLYATLAVVLSHLDDLKNAKLAYERATNLDQQTPTICLNFAIFEFKYCKNVSEAAKWLKEFDKRAGVAPDMIPEDEQQILEKLRIALQLGKEENEQESSEYPQGGISAESNDTISNNGRLPYYQVITTESNRGNMDAEENAETASIMTLNSHYDDIR